MDWLMILTIVSAVVTSASVALHVISPLTKTTADDKLTGWVDWLVRALKVLALNKSNA